LQGPHLIWTNAYNAPSSNPHNWQRAPALFDGGYGLGLIDSITAKVKFKPTTNGNQARLWFAKTKGC